MSGLILLGFLLGCASISAVPIVVESIVRGGRQRLLGNPRQPAGKTTALEGWVRAPRLVRSPIGGLRSALAYTRIAPSVWSLWHGRRRVELQAAADFFLETAEGPVFVRASDVWIHEVGAPSGQVPAIDGRLAEALRAAGLADTPELVYHEAVIFPGDRIRVHGILRDDPAPPELAARTGYRDAPTTRTLSGGGGALRIERLR